MRRRRDGSPVGTSNEGKSYVGRAALALLPLLSLVALREDLRTLLPGWNRRGAEAASPLRPHAQRAADKRTADSSRGHTLAGSADARQRRRLAEDTNGDGVADAFTFYTRTAVHVCLPYTVDGASQLTQNDLQAAVMDVFKVSGSSRVELTDVGAGSAERCNGAADLCISIFNEGDTSATAADTAAAHVAIVHQAPDDFLVALAGLLPVGGRAISANSTTASQPQASDSAALHGRARREAAEAALSSSDVAKLMSIPTVGFDVTWPEVPGLGASGGSESASVGSSSGVRSNLPWWAWLLYALVAVCCLCPLLACALRWRRPQEDEDLDAEPPGKKGHATEGLQKIYGPQWAITSLDFENDPQLHNELSLAQEYEAAHQDGRATESVTPPALTWPGPSEDLLADASNGFGGSSNRASGGEGVVLTGSALYGSNGGSIAGIGLGSGAEANSNRGSRGVSLGGRGSMDRNDVTDQAWAGSAHRRSSFPETHRMNFDASSSSSGGGYFDEFGWDGE